MQSYSSKCRSWFLVHTLQINKKQDSNSTMSGRKGEYRCFLGILGLKWRPFPIIRLWCLVQAILIFMFSISVRYFSRFAVFQISLSFLFRKKFQICPLHRGKQASYVLLYLLLGQYTQGNLLIEHSYLLLYTKQVLLTCFIFFLGHSLLY